MVIMEHMGIEHEPNWPKQQSYVAVNNSNVIAPIKFFIPLHRGSSAGRYHHQFRFKVVV
jgi:hypothetical protein